MQVIIFISSTERFLCNFLVQYYVYMKAYSLSHVYYNMKQLMEYFQSIFPCLIHFTYNSIVITNNELFVELNDPQFCFYQIARFSRYQSFSYIICN